MSFSSLCHCLTAPGIRVEPSPTIPTLRPPVPPHPADLLPSAIRYTPGFLRLSSPLLTQTRVPRLLQRLLLKYWVNDAN